MSAWSQSFQSLRISLKCCLRLIRPGRTAVLVPMIQTDEIARGGVRIFLGLLRMINKPLQRIGITDATDVQSFLRSMPKYRGFSFDGVMYPAPGGGR